MLLNSLVEQLARYGPLSPAEETAVHATCTGVRAVRRGALLRAERQPAAELFVVQRGWLFCSMLLEDGRRQIIRFHFRGELLGTDMLSYREAPDAVTALTDAEICLIDRERFGRLFTDHPRLGALFYAIAQVDRVSLTDRLTSLGRSSAKGRVAALLLWMAERLRAVDAGQHDKFVLPMTQEEIGDATGLTAVHVNRTLRALQEQGLIERSRSTLRLIDPDRLARIANLQTRREQLQADWMPPPR